MLEYLALFLPCGDCIVRGRTYVSYIYIYIYIFIYMLVEQSGWGPSSFQFSACFVAFLSPAAATDNKNIYRGTQRNDSRQFCNLPT